MARTDQRKKRRISMIGAAVVKQDDTKSPVEAYIINISFGGVGIYIREPLEGRVQIAICLKIGPDRQVAETVWGHVIWKEKIGSAYAVGISFEGLNHKDHNMLLSFMERDMK